MAQVNKSTMIGELLQIDQNIAPILLNIVPFLFARRLFDSFIILPES